MPLQIRLLAAVNQLPETIVCLLPGPHGLSFLQDRVSLIVVDPMADGPALVANVCRFARMLRRVATAYRDAHIKTPSR
ncbi:MAG TPA: hypothetical protein VNU46_07025 [Gemmatimonadaceae bacterium]|nr:hypothetical protein [Gemmatimonadaceae bacterium]